MRRLLAASAVVLLIGGCGDDSSSDKDTSNPPRLQPSQPRQSKVAPPSACLRTSSEPGKVPKGTYKTEYFFAGQMTVVFDKGWAVGEDSTGEFASAENKNPDLRSHLLGRRVSDKAQAGAATGEGRARDGGWRCRLAARESESFRHRTTQGHDRFRPSRNGG